MLHTRRAKGRINLPYQKKVWCQWHKGNLIRTSHFDLREKSKLSFLVTEPSNFRCHRAFPFLLYQPRQNFPYNVVRTESKNAEKEETRRNCFFSWLYLELPLLGGVLEEPLDRPGPADGQDDLVGVDVLQRSAGDLVPRGFQLHEQLLDGLHDRGLQVREDPLVVRVLVRVRGHQLLQRLLGIVFGTEWKKGKKCTLSWAMS